MCLERSCPRHVFAIYQWCTSIRIGDMNNFRNFNANLETFNVDSEVKVKVTGSKISCAWTGHDPRHVCAQYQRCTSIGIGDMRIFRNFNTDPEVKVTGVKTRIGCSAEHMCHLPGHFQKFDKGKYLQKY